MYTLQGHLERQTNNAFIFFFFNYTSILSRTFVRLSVQRVLEIKIKNKTKDSSRKNRVAVTLFSSINKLNESIV